MATAQSKLFTEKQNGFADGYTNFLFEWNIASKKSYLRSELSVIIANLSYQNGIALTCNKFTFPCFTLCHPYIVAGVLRIAFVIAIPAFTNFGSFKYKVAHTVVHFKVADAPHTQCYWPQDIIASITIRAKSGWHVKTWR